MSCFRSVLPMIALVALPLGGGCAATRPSPLTFTVRQTAVADRTTLLDVARAVLVEAGFEVGSVDVTALVLTTRPQPVPTRDSRVRRFRLSSRGRRRRIATVRFVPEPAGTKVYCRVAVEEQTTQAHRFMFDNEQGSDVPRSTAIDRDAATTTDQNTVWQLIHRDKETERRIVTRILAGTASPVSP